MNKTIKSNDHPYIPTTKQFRDLANRLRAAHKEECERGECQCVTVEEHERRLGH